MDIDQKIFEAVNSFRGPDFLTETAVYIHGYKHVEVAFFLFCLSLVCVLLVAPKKGMRASILAFAAAMGSVFLVQFLKKIVSRPAPYLDEATMTNLRVEPLANISAFPVGSTTLVSAVAVTLMYYFPKFSGPVVIFTLLYAMMPIYLGVAFPSDAIGSLILGYLFSYTLVIIVGRRGYFRKY